MMENDKKIQYIIIFVLGILLLLVVSFVAYSIVNNKKGDESKINIMLQQVYSSDYSLSILSDKYFIGTYSDNKIGIIIDKNGKEIYRGLNDLVYDGIFVLKDGNYLIYSNNDNSLRTYIFDGKNINLNFKIDDVQTVSPLIYKKGSSEYIIGFVSHMDNSTYLFPLDNTGVIVLEDKEIVADYQENGNFYTYNENSFIVKDESGHYGSVNKNGEEIVGCKYKDMLNTDDGNYVALNEKDKFGIINKNGDPLLKFDAIAILPTEGYYLVVNSRNKMGLFNKEFKNITGFKMDYDDLIQFNIRSKTNSVKVSFAGNYILVANNYMENMNGTEFNKHSLYVIREDKIIKEIKEVAFGTEDVLYTMDKNKKISIFDKKLEKETEFSIHDLKKIKNLSRVSEQILKIDYYDDNDALKEFYCDLEGNEVENSFGELLFKNAIYSVYKKEEGSSQKIVVYDHELKKVQELQGNYIDLEKEYIIVDNSIYKIVVS